MRWVYRVTVIVGLLAAWWWFELAIWLLVPLGAAGTVLLLAGAAAPWGTFRGERRRFMAAGLVVLLALGAVPVRAGAQECRRWLFGDACPPELETNPGLFIMVDRRLCGARIERRGDVTYVQARALARCLGAGYDHNWRTGEMSMWWGPYVVRANPVTNSPLLVVTRPSVYNGVERYNLGASHPYESPRDNANMMPVRALTDALGLFIRYDHELRTIYVQTDVPALPPPSDRARITQGRHYHLDRELMTYRMGAEPADGWDLLPSTMRHLDSWVSAHSRLIQKTGRLGPALVSEPHNQRIRVYHPTEEGRLVADAYASPAGNYVVLWMTPAEIEAWADRIRSQVYWAGAAGGGASVGATILVALGLVAAPVTTAMVSIGALFGGPVLYQRGEAARLAERCARNGRAAFSQRSGLVVTSTGQVSCVAEPHDLPISSAGIHY